LANGSRWYHLWVRVGQTDEVNEISEANISIASAISKYCFHYITMNFRRVKPLVDDDDDGECDQKNVMNDSLGFQGASEVEISGSDDEDMTGSDNELKDGDDDMDTEGEESDEEEQVHFCILDPSSWNTSANQFSPMHKMLYPTFHSVRWQKPKDPLQKSGKGHNRSQKAIGSPPQKFNQLFLKNRKE